MREARVSIVNTQKASNTEYDSNAVVSLAKERIESVSRDRPDLILMSELFANCQQEHTPEGVAKVAQEVPGPISEELSALAKKYRTYIAFGLLRKQGDNFYNSLVLLDRDGKNVWTYDKFTPMATETENCAIMPGKKPQAYDCDFGRIGGAICFDINFLELGELYNRQDVELMLFSSAFPAGRLLDIWAIRYGLAVAGSTWYDNNRILDCTGALVAKTSDIMPHTTAKLNLNRRVVHMDWKLDKLDKMRTDLSGDVLIEDMRDEATCVITSLKKGLEVADLIKQYEIEKLPDYLDRSRQVRANNGGVQMPVWF